MSDTPKTQRWVAAPDSAGRAAGALLRLGLRRRRWWVFVASVEVLFTVMVVSLFDDRYGTASRLVWGPVYALVPTLVTCGLVLGVTHLQNRRRFRQRLSAGVVLESAIGEHHVVLSGPWSTSTISLDGIASLRSTGSWVFLQLVGSPVLGVWPAELFPQEELHRLQRSIATRRS